MKSGIILAVLIVAAMACAGCTGDDAPALQARAQHTLTPDSTSSGTVAVTTVPQPVTSVTEATTNPDQVRIFNGSFTWAEYRENNTITLPPNPRYQWEYSVRIERSAVNYQGSLATHDKITAVSDYPEWADHVLTSTKDGHVAVEDTYYDVSTDRLRSGSLAVMINGVVQPPAEYSAYDSNHAREDCPAGWLGITPFGEMNITLTDEGTESVTVPAGTYPGARRYTGKFRDGTPITFWVVPGIPVPVQYQFPNREFGGVDPFQSYELKGWG